MSRMSFCIAGFSLPLPTISNDCTSGIPAASMVASWRLNTAMSSGATLPPLLNAADCFLIRLTAMPWRRRSARNAVSSGARLLPETRLPFLSIPDHENGTSRLTPFAPLVAAAVAMIAGSLFDRHAVDFFDAGQACLDLLEACSPQIPDTFLRGLVCDVDGVAAFHDDAADGFGDRHDLVDAATALVAVTAVGATLRAVDLHAGADVGFLESFLQQRFRRHIHDDLALRAQAPCEALRNDETDRGCDGVRLHAHVDETRHRLRRIVGMQCGHDQVAGLRGLDGDFRRLEVANFADHDDVRILAKEGAKRRGEREANLGVDVHLVDAGQIDFRRVFGRGDVGVFTVENVETGVERHGFTRAGRTGDEDHALRLREVLEIDLALERFVTQRVDAEHCRRGIENTADDFFAEQRGAGADAEVDGARLRQFHLDAAVLRHATLGDVEARHDLEARRQFHGELHRGLRDFFQDAVDAQTDAVHLFVRLEMDIRRVAANGVEQ